MEIDYQWDEARVESDDFPTPNTWIGRDRATALTFKIGRCWAFVMKIFQSKKLKSELDSAEGSA